MVPYIAKIKEEKSLPESQSLLLWDAFKAQSTQKVKDALATHNIELVMVPKNMTHLLQPLDLTTNASFKKFEKRAFTEYFTSCIMKALEIDPDLDAASIEVDLRLSTLKPRHAKVMTELYDHLRTQAGKDIIRAISQMLARTSKTLSRTILLSVLIVCPLGYNIHSRFKKEKNTSKIFHCFIIFFCYFETEK